ncbi:carbohydrate ABC transporter permease [Rhodoferax sp.]|uniref:carbohydrate ABC transporter permease n=1 Tax=Rhodoferax sp. TaxID=50421 RepID=UPI00374DEAF7
MHAESAVPPSQGRGAALAWSIASILLTAVLVLLWVFPLLWALSTSLRPEEETVQQPLRWLPQEWTLKAFSNILSTGSLPTWMFNSIVTSVAVTALTVLISVMAAYAFSQLRFRGRGIFFFMAMVGVMFPFEALLIPLFRLMHQLGAIDTLAGIVLPQIVSPMAIYVFRNFFDAIPKDFREAAIMEGANEFQVLWNVYVPISANILWAMAIIVFIGAWNNFLWPFIVITSPDMMTVPVGLTQIQDAFGVRYAQTMAAALLGGAPVAIAYLLFQKRVTQGFLAATGLKG